MKTTIERRFKDYGQQWEEITLDQAIHDLESGGYWKQGSTRAMLLEGAELWTPFAQYRLNTTRRGVNGLGNPTQMIETELRLEIKRHLDKCDPALLPKVCAILKSGGYETLEARIIQMIIKDQITPSAAISHIESEA